MVKGEGLTIVDSAVVKTNSSDKLLNIDFEMTQSDLKKLLVTQK